MKAIGVNILYAAPREDRRRTRAWGRRLTASVALAFQARLLRVVKGT